jgi:flagellin FlaB
LFLQLGGYLNILYIDEQNTKKGGKEEMFNKFVKALNTLHKGQKGISGLETAIILIAFVTVASVLAYSVLSAGIFSAEEGQKAVYAGLEGAQSTLEVKGSVLGLSAGGTELETVQVVLGMAIAGNTVDMDAVSINFWDDTLSSTNVTWTYALSAQSTERGSTNLLEGDELMVVSVTIPVAATVAIYDTFTLQILPPNGSALTIERTIGGSIEAVMTLN